MTGQMFSDTLLSLAELISPPYPPLQEGEFYIFLYVSANGLLIVFQSIESSTDKRIRFSLLIA